MLDESFIKGILVIIEKFYKNQFILKVMPFQDNLYLRFIGTINENFLRESIESLILKYGTCPVSEWWIFGQISSIFPKNYNPIPENERYNKTLEAIGKLNNLTSEDEKERQEALNLISELNLQEDIEIIANNGLDLALENIFNSFRGLDYISSPKFPSITFTPIAVYRGE